MRIVSCADGDDLVGYLPDLIVLPEYVDRTEIARVEELCPNAIVAGAFTDAGAMRGVLRHGGCDRISYMKILGDGRSVGAGEQPDQVPVYGSGDIAVGLLVCLDIQEPTLVGRVLAELRRRPARLKVLCIPAAMHASSWSFEDGAGILGHAGLHAVVLTNGMPIHPSDRMRSFIFNQTNLVRHTEGNNRRPILVELNS